MSAEDPLRGEGVEVGRWSSKTGEEVVASIKAMVEAIRDAPVQPFVPVFSARMFSYPHFVRTRKQRNRWLAALRKFFEKNLSCSLGMPALKGVAKGDLSAWPERFRVGV